MPPMVLVALAAAAVMGSHVYMCASAGKGGGYTANGRPHGAISGTHRFA